MISSTAGHTARGRASRQADDLQNALKAVSTKGGHEALCEDEGCPQFGIGHVCVTAAPKWFWRNCRDIGFSVHFWPLAWRFGFERDADVYGGDWRLQLGPIMLVLSANIGNCSSYNRFEAWRGLSEVRAEERAERFAARLALSDKDRE